MECPLHTELHIGIAQGKFLRTQFISEMPRLIEHIEAARRSLHIAATEVVAVPRIKERLPVFIDLLLVVQHS